MGWRERAVRAAVHVPPFTSQRFRDAWLRRRRAQRRAARRRAEARGDRSLSYPALHGMDRRLEALLDLEGGFFVEAGANDGYQQSNTYALERFHGWRGVLVEPIPELYREALVERPASTVVNAALVPFGHPEDTVEMRYGNLMSSVVGAHGSDEADREYVAAAFALGLESERTVRVPARPLSDILDEAGAPEIDLISLDVEGFEIPALGGLDLDRHAPRLMLVEIYREHHRAPIEALLADALVPVAELSPIDVLFARRDQDLARLAERARATPATA
jgi:FkbM family methyltransferase